MDALLDLYRQYRKGIVAALGALLVFVPELRDVFNTLLVVVPDVSKELIPVLTAAGVVAVRND